MTKLWVVSAFALVSWREGQLVITSAVSGTTLTINDISLIRLIHAFAQPKTIEEVVQQFSEFSPEQVIIQIDNLIRSGILNQASELEEATSHHWHWSALAYHWQSRRKDFQKNFSKSIPAKVLESKKDWIPLLKGHSESGRDFANVLESRRSWRKWPDIPIEFETFSKFLWLSARNRIVYDEEIHDEYISRPYPSGGAVYSLELYLVIATNAVKTMNAGIYRYLPEQHGLETLSVKTTDYLPFLETAAHSAGTITPPVLVLVTSQFEKQSKTYNDLAYSLVLKEVGCLFQTMYLVAEYLKLGPCALGGGSPNGRLAHLCNTNELKEPLVGEFMLGPQ